jgi:hypothetical protein
MTVQYAAIPSCGPRPSFEIHTANFDDTLHQFDWNLVNHLNVESIKATGDSDSLEKLLYSFVDSRFGAVERQFLPFPLSAKFYQLLQLGIDYLLTKLRKNQRQVAQRDLEIEYLKHKLEKSIDRLDSLPKFANCDVKVVHSCPVCSRAFKAMLYLDKHIGKCHPEHGDAWRALRHNELFGVAKAFTELHQDIDHLRACITRQDLCAEPPVDHPDCDRMPIQPKPWRPHQRDPSGRIAGFSGIEPGGSRRSFLGDFSSTDST